MKSTFFLSTLALALTATAQITEISPKEFEDMQKWAEDLFPSPPACVDKCMNLYMSDDDSQNIIPPCAVSDQDSEDAEMNSYNNSISCLCADRIFQANQLECVFKTCAEKDMETALKYQLTSMYTMCAVYTNQAWPEPKTVLAELCVADEVPKDVTLPDIPEIFKDAPIEVLAEYKYADEWPSQTATTWAPAGTPIPDTREPLECQAKSGDDASEDDAEEEVDAAETSGTRTAAGPKVTQGAGTNGTVEDIEEADGAAAGSARVGGLMMAVAGLVGGLAVLL